MDNLIGIENTVRIMDVGDIYENNGIKYRVQTVIKNYDGTWNYRLISCIKEEPMINRSIKEIENQIRGLNIKKEKLKKRLGELKNEI